MFSDLEPERLRVLSRYPADIAAGPWLHLHDAGGFSGAHVWRSPRWRLKASPAVTTSQQQLSVSHRWMRQASTCDFVPRVAVTCDLETVISEGLWIWDVVSWMPGEPLLRSPTPARLAAAGRALATLHGVWRSVQSHTGSSDAVIRRLDRIQSLRSNRSPILAAEQDIVSRLASWCVRQLTPWRAVPLPLHPCLCDIWTAHVLFEDDLVSGFIDFGSARIDHPAADLARLLGDCLGGEPDRWQPLLEAYSAIRPLSLQDHALLAVLEATGAVASLATWIDRLQSRSPTKLEAERIAKLAARCSTIMPII